MMLGGDHSIPIRVQKQARYALDKAGCVACTLDGATRHRRRDQRRTQHDVSPAAAIDNPEVEADN